MGGEGAQRWKFKGRNGIPLQGSFPNASSSNDKSCQARVPHSPSWSPGQVLGTSRQLQTAHLKGAQRVRWAQQRRHRAIFRQEGLTASPRG